MAEFRPLGLFYDALSAEFAPPTDPSKRLHTLARLAVATCDKGQGPDDYRSYTPSWARNSYSIVEQPVDRGPFDTQVTIGESYGRWPREIRFTHHRTNPTESARRDELVITERNLEIVHPLELGNILRATRTDVADIAQDFYNNLKP